tara:strand:- start:52882 stop:55356 length:2475 start_codon:yes stop_codon:yes gene_type:complete
LRFAEIAVDSPIGHGRTFSYEIPDHMMLQIGHMVLVPFGTQILQGIVFSLENSPSVDKTKFIIEITDPEPLLDQDRLDLVKWISGYYLCTLFEACALMIPPGIREYEAIWVYWNDSYEGDISNIKLSDYQLKILNYVKSRKKTRLSKLISNFGDKARTSVSHLIKMNILYRETLQKDPVAKPLFIEELLITDLGRELVNLDEFKSSVKQKNLLRYMNSIDLPAKASEIRKEYGYSVVKSLLNKKLLELKKNRVYRDPLRSYKYDNILPKDIDLTREQSEAVAIISEIMANPDSTPRAMLIHGVTGSGKTEVYLEAVKECVNKGKRAIILVPEIALTPQTIERFASNFKNEIAVVHSGLSIGERFDQWHKIREGNYNVVIGSRTALFSPQPNLGLVIIDEEHEWTYKQSDMPPRYHARDVAMQLAGITRCTVILGSASPDMQSFFRANNERYKFVQLNNRYTSGVQHSTSSDGRGLADVHVTDMRNELKEGNTSIFSRTLQASIEDTLSSDNQVILFLNRRGASSFSQCRSCGYVLKCKSCDVTVTFHKTQSRLICHYCNNRFKVPDRCSECNSGDFAYYGIGTQSVEDEVNKLFPLARCIRWDSDVSNNLSSHSEILEKFRSKEANVLVGTQILAKGHNLPGVTLVGAILADVGLNIPDFRSAERSFQLLCQVSGRAGRGDEKGKVIIQTYQPDHYSIVSASLQDYQRFFDIEAQYRKKFVYPPYSKIIKLFYQNTSDAFAEREALRMVDELKSEQHNWGLQNIDIIGPIPGFPSRVRGHYRWQVILKGENPRLLLDRIYLRSHQNSYGKTPKGWLIDVDPVFT